MNQNLREALSTRDNALNFVRLVLAIVVIFEHTWVIGGYENALEIPLASWAVNGFFALSGYLIAGARMRSSLRTFMLRRIARIFPAFWTVLVLTAFVVAPLASLAGSGRWELGSALSYVTSNGLLWVRQFGVAETLSTVPYPNVWNGSLWTLFFEFGAYIAAALFLSLAITRRHALPLMVVGVAGIVALQILAYGPLDISTSLILSFLRLGAFFAAGMLWYFLGDRIKLGLWPFVLTLVLMCVLFATGVASWVGQLPFAFLLLWLGARLPIRLGSRNDISYGVYVWAFPVQQFVIVLGLAWLGPWGTALLSLLVTLPIGWASWRFVEKPCLDAAHRVPKSWLGTAPDSSNARRPR